MTDLRFDDRVVVVTGAGRGVGRSHALLLASKGARVVVADYGVDIDGRGSSSGPADAVVAEICEAGGDAVACFASVADERSMDQINASMPPDLCAPAAAFLAHESCALNGEVLQAGMGGVSRIAVVVGQGIWRSPMTAEDIADNIDTIMNVDDAGVTDVVLPRM